MNTNTTTNNIKVLTLQGVDTLDFDTGITELKTFENLSDEEFYNLFPDEDKECAEYQETFVSQLKGLLSDDELLF